MKKNKNKDSANAEVEKLKLINSSIYKKRVRELTRLVKGLDPFVSRLPRNHIGKADKALVHYFAQTIQVADVRSRGFDDKDSNETSLKDSVKY